MPIQMSKSPKNMMDSSGFLKKIIFIRVEISGTRSGQGVMDGMDGPKKHLADPFLSLLLPLRRTSSGVAEIICRKRVENKEALSLPINFICL